MRGIRRSVARNDGACSLGHLELLLDARARTASMPRLRELFVISSTLTMSAATAVFSLRAMSVAACCARAVADPARGDVEILYGLVHGGQARQQAPSGPSGGDRQRFLETLPVMSEAGRSETSTNIMETRPRSRRSSRWRASCRARASSRYRRCRANVAPETIADEHRWHRSACRVRPCERDQFGDESAHGSVGIDHQHEGQVDGPRRSVEVLTRVVPQVFRVRPRFCRVLCYVLVDEQRIPSRRLKRN